MIYTVTLNPSLDYVIEADDIKIGHVNRTKNEAIYPGGKGLNVSIMLKALGEDSKILGFIAGFTGKTIEKLLAEQGCDTDFIEIKKGFSRINVKLQTTAETEINGQGVSIGDLEINKLYNKLEALNNGDFLVLAGSIPKGAKESIYEDILERVKDKSLKLVVDTKGSLIKGVLKYKPFLIKPNNFELMEAFGAIAETDEQIVYYAKKLKEMGAVNVLVSLGKKGAVLVSEKGVYIKEAPKGKVINTVGAGDSMVAGFLKGYLKYNGDYEQALKFGICAGSATAFSKWLANKDEIYKLIGNLE